MKYNYVSAKDLKSLEDYVCSLVSGLISLQTLATFPQKALDLGLLKEEMNETAKTILWDLSRLMKLYKIHAENVLELLPDDFDFSEAIEKLKLVEVKKAKQMVKKK